MIVEVVLLAVGVLCILLLVPLARQTVGTGQANAEWAGGLGALAVQGNAMSYQVAEMLLGLGCIFLCSLLFRARLVPRLLAIWGAIGYAILMTGAVAEIFGIHIGLVFSIPGGLFELTLGVWLIVRGFRPPAYGDRVETVRIVDRSPSLVHAVAEGETR